MESSLVRCCADLTDDIEVPFPSWNGRQWVFSAAIIVAIWRFYVAVGTITP
jgi:hypothetical protein